MFTVFFHRNVSAVASVTNTNGSSRFLSDFSFRRKSISRFHRITKHSYTKREIKYYYYFLVLARTPSNLRINFRTLSFRAIHEAYFRAYHINPVLVSCHWSSLSLLNFDVHPVCAYVFVLFSTDSSCTQPRETHHALRMHIDSVLFRVPCLHKTVHVSGGGSRVGGTCARVHREWGNK